MAQYTTHLSTGGNQYWLRAAAAVPLLTSLHCPPSPRVGEQLALSPPHSLTQPTQAQRVCWENILQSPLLDSLGGGAEEEAQHKLAYSLFSLDSSTHLSYLTLPMLRLYLSKAQKHRKFWKTFKPCHVGMHWKALDEYYLMGTHVPGFQWLTSDLHHFVFTISATSSARVNPNYNAAGG